MNSRKRTTTALIAAALTLTSLPGATAQTTTPDSANAGFIAGVRFNNGQRHGLLTLALKPAPRWITLLNWDIGDPADAYGGRFGYILPLTDRLHLIALLGPQVEEVELDPSADQTIGYLGAATGMVGSYRLLDPLTVWAGIDRLYIADAVEQWKYGLGLSLWFHIGKP